MKSISIIILFVFMAISNFASISENISKEQCLLEYQELVVKYDVSVDLMNVPYLVDERACMKKVFSKDEYSIWKVPADKVVSYPNDLIIGSSYNYFVFKGEDFHMTVQKYNKDNIFKFFNGDIY